MVVFRIKTLMCSDYVLDSANECERLRAPKPFSTAWSANLRHLPKILPRERGSTLDLWARARWPALWRQLTLSGDVVGIDFNPNYNLLRAQSKVERRSPREFNFRNKATYELLRFATASF